MMIVPAGVKVHLALGYTDMRKGMDGQADAGPGRAEQGSIKARNSYTIVFIPK